MVTQLRTGAVQFAALSDGTLPAVAPVLSIMQVAFTFRTFDQVQRAVDGPLGAFLRKEIEAQGPVVMGSGTMIIGFRQITNSLRPVYKVGDVAGMKLRVTSNILLDLWRSLGASPVPLPVEETYTALQTHLVDGTDYPIAAVEIFRSFEVQKYLSLTNQCFGSSYYLLSGADAWNALPPDIQQTIRRLEPQYAAAQRRDIRLQEASLLDKLQRQGMMVNRADSESFRQKLLTSGYYARWRATFGETAWDLLQRASNMKLG
jgi:TRAP-type C4-dicarboxylate transport system substrate-binding protein